MRGCYRYLALLLLLCMGQIAAQQRDSTYVYTFKQRMWGQLYGVTQYLTITHEGKSYMPNIPVGLGASVGWRGKHSMSIGGAINVAQTTPENGFRTRSDDFQWHNYWRHVIVDAYYQKYKGFYVELPDDQQYLNYPELTMQQIGLDVTYVWNGNRLSAAAAFDQSELQLRSAGSFLFGNSLFWHRVVPLGTDVAGEPFENWQAGFSAGYMYTWVLGRRWAMTIGSTVGANIGNESVLLRRGKLKVYPISVGRISVLYNCGTWIAAVQGVFTNKGIHSAEGQQVNIYMPSLQLGITKHFNL